MERSGAGWKKRQHRASKRQKQKQKQEYRQLIDDDGIFEVVKRMSTTRREVPVTSIYAKAVFTGNVSGDVDNNHNP